MSDLINRQAALDTLKGFNVVEIIDYEHGVIYVQAIINAIYNRLNNLPSAESEWTAKVDRDTIFPVTVCGVCHSTVSYSNNYCSNCGVKLDWSGNE